MFGWILLKMKENVKSLYLFWFFLWTHRQSSFEILNLKTNSDLIWFFRMLSLSLQPLQSKEKLCQPLYDLNKINLLDLLPLYLFLFLLNPSNIWSAINLSIFNLSPNNSSLRFEKLLIAKFIMSNSHASECTS